MLPNQQPAVIYPVTSNQQLMLVKEHHSNLNSYPKNTSLILGILQVLCGVACIILGGLAIPAFLILGSVGYGLWSGVFAFLAGCFAIKAAVSKSKCWIVTTMVMSIIAACLTSAPLALAITDATFSPGSGNYYDYHYHYYGNEDNLAISILLCIFLFAQGVLAIWSSAIACRYTCAKSCRDCCCTCYDNAEETRHNVIVPVTVTYNSGGQMLIVQNNAALGQMDQGYEAWPANQASTVDSSYYSTINKLVKEHTSFPNPPYYQ